MVADGRGPGFCGHGISGFGNDGVISDATWVSLNNGYALSFDGTDDSIRLPASLSQITGDFTLWGWAKTENSGDIEIISTGYGRNDVTRPYSIHITAPTGVRLRMGNGAAQLLSGNVAVTTTEWNFYTATIEGTPMKMFVNAGTPGTGTFSGTRQTGLRMYLGQVGNGTRKLQGLMGEVGIYNRALTPLEIEQNYLATKWRYE